jgi:2-polyprenyl-3-methyl-5-hydroxy-6-metoxy-1,4-benzoquinol methylase
MTDYRSRAYDRYSASTTLDHARYAASYRRRLDGVLAPRPEWRCLDIACGYGNFLAYLRACGVTAFTGIDSSKQAIEVARLEFGESHVAEVDADIYLGGTRERYELVSAIDFLEHLTKPELHGLLDGIRTALGPGGLFLARTPNAQGLFGMAARYNDITHEVCFTPGSLGDVLKGAGFEVVAIWEDQGRPTTALQAAHWVAWKIVRFGIRCADAAETGMWSDGVLTRNMWVLARRP